MSDEELGIKVPGGIGLWFKGSQMFPVILLLLLAAFVVLLVWQSDSRSAQRDAETKAAISRLADVAVKADETQQAMIYVLSLPQAEREKLNLMKPKGLTAMQR